MSNMETSPHNLGDAIERLRGKWAAITAFGVLLVVLAIDVVVFRFAVQVASKLDPSRMLVTEKVFGFLLAALGVQLVLNGLSDVGVIHLTTGH